MNISDTHRTLNAALAPIVSEAVRSSRIAGRSVFDPSGSVRPGASKAEGGGGKRKQENRGGRGPGLKTLTDLVHEGCNRPNGRNGPPTRGLEGRRGHPDLRWGTPRLNRIHPGVRLVAEAILTFKRMELV